MFYTYYTAPNESRITILSDGEYLTGLYFNKNKGNEKRNDNLEIFSKTKEWLDIYFSGKEPDFKPKYKLTNVSNFTLRVLEEVEKIPYSKSTTYGDIAKTIAKEKGIEKMSAQAVGSAVGRNPICIIIPCHRVLAKGKKLGGYAGGIENKIMLLKTENNYN